MKPLNMRIIELAVLFLVSGCVFGRDRYVALSVRKPPDLLLKDQQVLVLPMVLVSQDFRLDRDLHRFFMEVAAENRDNIAFIAPATPFDVSRRYASEFFKKGSFEREIFHNYGAKYILLHYMMLEREYFSPYSDDDQLNPAYSVESGGAPGLFETPNEWRARSFNDYVFRARSRFVIISAETGAVLLDKTVENSFVLEDYRYKDVDAESRKIFYSLTQINTEVLLSFFRDRTVPAGRVYLK